MAARANIGVATFSLPYKTLQVAWKKAVEGKLATFSSEGLNILVTQAGLFQSGSQTVFCLHEETAHLFSIPQKTPEWLHIEEMAARARKSSKTVSSLYKTLQVAWKKAVEDRLSTFSSEGLNILVTQAGFFRSGNQTPFCLHQNLAPFLVALKKDKQNASAPTCSKPEPPACRRYSSVRSSSVK